MAVRQIRLLFGHTKEIVVLMYHSIDNINWEFAISPSTLEKQIKYLFDNKYKFLSSSDIYEIISGVTEAPRKGVLITFDDGYEDFIINAVPILNKYGARAIIFPHTDRLSNNLGNNIRLLSTVQISQLSKAGIEIGNHSHSHFDSKSLSNEEIEKELQKSEDIIEDIAGNRPLIFAYPGGKFDQRIINILKDRGYKIAFTIDRGLISKGDDSMRVKRFGISKKTSFLEFKARITIVSEWYEKIIRAFKHNK